MMATTLADHLRSLSDDALGALLRRRPDLVVPVPADVSALAVRAQSRVSVARAMDGLDEFTLRILDAARLSRPAGGGPTSLGAVLALAAAPAHADAVRAALDRLRGLFLLYGPDDALHVSAGVDEVGSPYPAGLGRPAGRLDPAAGALCADPARLRRAVLAAPPNARAVLDRLAAGPPVGTLTTATDGPGDNTDGADNPVHWLVEHHLLVPVSPGGGAGPAGPAGLASPRLAPGESRYEAVELPREVGLLLRRETGPLGPLRPSPPAVAAPAREPAAVDSAGAGQAMELVRQVEALVEALAAEPAPLLRTGGIGTREARRLARAAAVDEQVGGLLLEIAYAAGLIGEAEAAGRDRVGRQAPALQLLPSVGYDAWRSTPVSRRWGDLARAWLDMTRQPGLIGRRDERDRPINPLAGEVERAGAPATRRAVLGTLADLPPGATPDVEELLGLLAWHQPRRAKLRDVGAREAVDEAARLGIIGRGVTGLGALTSYGRLLLADQPAPDGDDPLGLRAGTDERLGGSPAARALGALLPPPVDHVLVQADLTVVVPGPPEPGLAAELDLVADHESGGGAIVYRVTPDSVRRGLDAGYAAEDLHGLFKRRSRTIVPQALTYLIDDVARRHGGLRTGSAGAYLRSDDEALLAEVLADRRLATLALRRLAPTVLVTPYQSGRLLTSLREYGYVPVPEDASGSIVLARPRVRRAATRGLTSRVFDPLLPAALTEPRVLGIVEQIRRGDAAARAARRAPVTVRAANGHGGDRPAAAQAHTQALAVLQQAVRDKALVWVGYVDAHGASASRLVRPVSIGGGYLRAEDERTEMLHTFALHRITAAVVED
jgi:hypothetical protein